MMTRLFFTIPIYAFWIALFVAAWSRIELWLWRKRAWKHLDKWADAVAAKDQDRADFHSHQWQGMYLQDQVWFDQHAENR